MVIKTDFSENQVQKEVFEDDWNRSDFSDAESWRELDCSQLPWVPYALMSLQRTVNLLEALQTRGKHKDYS